MKEQGPQPGSRKSAVDPRMRRLFRAIRKAGGDVERTNSGHYRVTKNGVFIVTIGSTPSEYRGQLNEIAAMRRAGLNIPKGSYR